MIKIFARTIYLSGLLLPLIWACSNEPAGDVQQGALPVGQGAAFRVVADSVSMSSPSCSEGGNRCALFSAVYPVVEPDSVSAHRQINDTLSLYVRNALSGISPSAAPSQQSLEEMGKAFLAEYDTAMADMTDFPQQWAAELSYEVMLEDSAVITFALQTYMFTGGAHPNSFATLASFDKLTGERLRLEDFVKDLIAFTDIAESGFREARELPAGVDLNAEGFFWGEGYFLPENIVLVEEGVHLHYNAYEAAPYAAGPTAYTIPFAQLSGLLKKRAKQ